MRIFNNHPTILVLSGGVELPGIGELEKILEDLGKADPESFQIFSDIFLVESSQGNMLFPESFKEKAREYFGIKKDGRVIESQDQVLGRLERQGIISIYNHWTGEGSLFNSLRAERPGISRDEWENELRVIDEQVKSSTPGCDFCQPEKYTPEDVFGRIKGRHCITGANIAKYDAWSSIIFFNRHHPLRFNYKEVADYLETGWSWFLRVQEQDPDYGYPTFLWNCLPRAGASQIHGHAQILMSKRPYAKFRALLDGVTRYRQEKDRDYFQDLYRCHQAVGLATGDVDLGVIASLTPVKEKELIILSQKSPYQSDRVKKTIYSVLRIFLDVLGVTSFNLSIMGPGLDQEKDAPHLVRMVDRGSMLKNTNDIGAMELYGSSVIANDPYQVIKALRQ
ncbi:MAG TPA: hypothetical protein PKK85_07275 [Methanobacteriaceae archaeon]|nr:hypothetical protein [Methanobacteriaceae archaeon]